MDLDHLDREPFMSRRELDDGEDFRILNLCIYSYQQKVRFLCSKE